MLALRHARASERTVPSRVVTHTQYTVPCRHTRRPRVSEWHSDVLTKRRSIRHDLPASRSVHSGILADLSQRRLLGRHHLEPCRMGQMGSSALIAIQLSYPFRFKTVPRRSSSLRDIVTRPT